MARNGSCWYRGKRIPVPIFFCICLLTNAVVSMHLCPNTQLSNLMPQSENFPMCGEGRQPERGLCLLGSGGTSVPVQTVKCCACGLAHANTWAPLQVPAARHSGCGKENQAGQRSLQDDPQMEQYRQGVRQQRGQQREGCPRVIRTRSLWAWGMIFQKGMGGGRVHAVGHREGAFPLPGGQQ